MLVSLVAAGCADSPGTSLLVSLSYDESLNLSTAELGLKGHVGTAPIAHEMLVLIPDVSFGEIGSADDDPFPRLDVWGIKSGKRVAYGYSLSAISLPGRTFPITVAITACTPGCQGNMLLSCTRPPETCHFGCSSGNCNTAQR